MVGLWRDHRRGKTFCPFEHKARISNRTCSRALQRRVVDFYIERSGQKTQQALREHYGIELSLHAVQKAGNEASSKARELNSLTPSKGINPSDLLIAQADGSMVPVIEFPATKASSPSSDRRRQRQCVWKEVRLCTVHDPKRQHARYGVSRGAPLEVGCMIHDTCRFEGMTNETHIHAVADGAPWIASQFEDQFGTAHSFLIDFYHVCEYLAAASHSMSLSDSEKTAWYDRQKNLLRKSCGDQVVRELASRIEEEGVSVQEDHPLVKTHRYLNNRLGHLDYSAALTKGLPIGSGEVESAHRSILQGRLKIPGAWWRLETAEKMAHLRVLRANERWNELWSQINAA